MHVCKSRLVLPPKMIVAQHEDNPRNEDVIADRRGPVHIPQTLLIKSDWQTVKNELGRKEKCRMIHFCLD